MANPCRDPRRRCMPIDEWPVVDRKALEAATDAVDLLDEGGLAAHWSAATRTKVIKSYGRWLTFLYLNGALDDVDEPAARVSRELLESYFKELRSIVAPVTVRGRILDLHEALRVMVPGADLSMLNRLYKRLNHAEPVRDKRAKVHHPARLIDLGITLMERATLEPVARPAWRAVRYRDGLMIACLAARPLRRRTFCRLAIGKSLVRVDDSYLLRIPADETKTHQPYEAPLPDTLTPYLDEYIDVLRPILLGGKVSSRLWITHMGTELTTDSFYLRLRKVTKRELGVPLNPHIFRDSLATSMAIDDPTHVRTAAPLLGHRSLSTTNRHYIQATGLEAGRTYQEQIAHLRKRYRQQNGIRRRD